MTTPTTTDLAPRAEMSAEVLETVLLQGDLARLKPEGRIQYMTRVCETLGLNPLTKPFEFISLNGKLVMYAKKDCTEQLRRIHGVSLTIVAREVIEGVYVVTARAQDKTGRHDESTGAVAVDKLTGEARANALMKAETKAKRRVTLSICGLGVLDESEVDSIPGAQPAYEAPRERYAPPGVSLPVDGHLGRVTGGAAQQPPKAAAESAKTPTTVSATSTAHIALSRLPGAASTAGEAIPLSPATAASAATTVSPSKRPTANQIVHDGSKASPGQVKAIHTMRGKIGGLTVCTDKAPCEIGTSRACMYHKQLGAFKSHTGQPITSSKDLSKGQADYLLERYEQKIEQQAKRVEAIDIGDITPTEPATSSTLLGDTLKAVTRDPGEYDDLQAELCGVFGVDSFAEMDKETATLAYGLLSAYSEGPEQYRAKLAEIQS